MAERIKWNEVHVWRTRASQVRDPSVVQRCFNTLNRRERERMSRFATADLRNLYLISHSLVRLMLSSFAPSSPETWQFDTNEWGAPCISGPDPRPALRFSLSHSGDHAACAVAFGREIGLDLEQLPAPSDISTIVKEVGSTFSEKEHAELRAQPVSDQPRYFAKLWTVREAYAKARGTGLSIAADSFSTQIEDRGLPRLDCHATREPEESEWCTWLMEVGNNCQQAVVARRRAGETLVISEREFRFDASVSARSSLCASSQQL